MSAEIRRPITPKRIHSRRNMENMAVHREIEWKYWIPDAEVLQRLLQVLQLGPYAIGSFQTRRVVDTYYDTPDRSFAAAGYAFRHRQMGDASVVHLKTLTPPQDGVHRRVELHAQTDEPALPANWPEGPARDLVLRTLQDQLLMQLFCIEQLRHIAPLLGPDGPVAELSLDEVRWVSDGRDCQALELEIELGEGRDDQAFVAVITELETVWQLLPLSRSKYERGLEWVSSFAAAEAETDPIVSSEEPERREARKRPGIAFQLDEPAIALIHRIIAVQTTKLHAEYAGVVKGEDTEALHDARVATRRMRSGLYFFAPWVPRRMAKELRRELRVAGRALGSVRDLDVSLAFVHEHAPLAAPEAEEPLRRYLEAERRRARSDLLNFYKGPGYKGLQKTLNQFIRAKISGRTTLADILPGLVNQAIAELAVFQGTLEPGSPVEHLHALRIAIKHLRYLLEFTRFAAYPTSDPLIDLTIDIQEELGQVHDAHVSCLLAFDLLRRSYLSLTANDRDALLAYGLALGRYRDERAAQFVALQPSPPWGVWLDDGTQVQVAGIAALLGGHFEQV